MEYRRDPSTHGHYIYGKPFEDTFAYQSPCCQRDWSWYPYPWCKNSWDVNTNVNTNTNSKEVNINSKEANDHANPKEVVVLRV